MYFFGAAFGPGCPGLRFAPVLRTQPGRFRKEPAGVTVAAAAPRPALPIPGASCRFWLLPAATRSFHAPAQGQKKAPGLRYPSPPPRPASRWSASLLPTRPPILLLLQTVPEWKRLRTKPPHAYPHSRTTGRPARRAPAPHPPDASPPHRPRLPIRNRRSA